MGHMRIFRLATVSAAFGLAVLGGTGWASLAAAAAQASTAPCMVVDDEIQASYTSLQAAEVAASPGDTLSATGTCTGTTEITQNLVAGLTPAHKPAAHKPAVSGSAPASLPRFYVTTSSGPGGRGIQAVVRASASGRVTGTVPVPSALPVEWADSGGTFVTAAADDRSFIIGVQGGQAPTKIGLDLRLFRFAISAAGKPGHLTELAPAPMRNETTEGIALSPDGKLLAVSLQNDSSPDPVGAIQVLNLATGAIRTWTAPARSVYIPGPPSWADGSRVIAFTWLRSTQPTRHRRLLPFSGSAKTSRHSRAPGTACGLELIRIALVTARCSRERSGRIRKRPAPVARKILLQLAVRDIGQLTDLVGRAAPQSGSRAARPGAHAASRPGRRHSPARSR